MYADFDTYVKRYGDDLSPFCDESTATRYLRAASREIDRFTFDRFGGTLPESTIDAEKLQDCACELAECLYRIDQARDSAAETADIGGVKTAGPVASVSSGSESITYKAADSCYTTAAKTTAARDELVFDLLRRWLSGVAVDGTLVLYAGGDVLMLLHSDTITLFFARARRARSGRYVGAARTSWRQGGSKNRYDARYDRRRAWALCAAACTESVHRRADLCDAGSVPGGG